VQGAGRRLETAFKRPSTVAALEAVALRQSLASGEDGLSQRYFKASRKIVDVAWGLASGSDLSLPEVEGARPILTRLSNAWAERILNAPSMTPTSRRLSAA
jgi:hypothetical protein